MEAPACVHHFAAKKEFHIVEDLREGEFAVMVCVSQFYKIPRFHFSMIGVLRVHIILQCNIQCISKTRSQNKKGLPPKSMKLARHNEKYGI